MSKFIYVVSKKDKNAVSKVKNVCQRITPDNFTPKSPIVNGVGNTTLGVFNPTDTILVNQTNVCLGKLINEKNWDKLSTELDGTFAVVRSDSDTVEVLTDVLATRTIWYFRSDDLFIVSSSQRMIISYLGSLEFNKNVIPWVLSSGTLGLNSWDKRLKMLDGDSKLILDKKTWDISIESKEVRFESNNLTYSENKNKIENVINQSIFETTIDLDKWSLPLSGGYDSRYILFNFPNKNEINSITWGSEISESKKGSDAYISKKLSQHFNTNHKYYNIEPSGEENAGILMKRFLSIGEGRTDNIKGYLDGFNIWNSLYNDNINGLIRGDEGFGWAPVKNEDEVRHKIGIKFLSEYQNIKSLLEDFDPSDTTLPKELSRREDESLEKWRDRLYHQYRVPVLLAGLNDLKLSHVEIMNPLISKKIIYELRTVPDKFRTDKKIFKDIVDANNPKISYAKLGSEIDVGTFLKSKGVVTEILSELETANGILPDNLINFVKSNIKLQNKPNNKRNVKRKIGLFLKRIIPNKLKYKIKSNTNMNIDVNLLAYRAYSIVMMHKILKEDSNKRLS